MSEGEKYPSSNRKHESCQEDGVLVRPDVPVSTHTVNTEQQAAAAPQDESELELKTALAIKSAAGLSPPWTSNPL